MEASLNIGEPIVLSSSTGGSFDLELRELLWSRVTKALGIGLVVSGLLVLIGTVIFPFQPHLQTSVSVHVSKFFYGHPISFALALAVLGVLRKKACAVKLQVAAFCVFAFNIALIMLSMLSCSPDAREYFGLSILLFVPAAFIPWRTRNQVGLGVAALLSFLIVMFWSRFNLPEVGAFWSAQLGSNRFLPHVVTESVSIALLGAVGVAISRTLYSLRKTAYKVQKLGNYLIDRELGAGGMGTVYLARHALICRPTAVKVMRTAEGEAQASLSRFEREVQLSAGLSHPNTINIFDFGRTEDDVFYYAMEYLPGMDLETLVQRFGPLEPARVAFILRQICGSLSEAHGRGILHRDIKPSNIFLSQRGGLYDFVKVLDFGLAKKLQTDASMGLTRTGMVFGTPRYIAPEALYGSEQVDARADLYNVGGVAYWMLTGQPPFATDSSVELIIAHVQNVPERPSLVSELEIPEDLDALIMKCLEKKPEDRYQNAEELAEAVEGLACVRSWSWRRAKEWWGLHGLDRDAVPDCV